MANVINGTDTGSGGLITTGDSSDELQLQTAETARVTLTNTAVVVNEGGNDVDFRVEGDTDANLLFVDASSDKIGIGASDPVGKIDCRGILTISNSVSSYWGFDRDNNTGDLTLSNSNTTPVLSFTDSGAYLRLASGTGGIQFGGDTAAANALDDYEEGTFTATLVPATSGTITVNSGIDLLAYTKIGRVVYVQGLLEISSVGSPVGTSVALQNLPFAIADLTEFAGRSGGAFLVGSTLRGLLLFETQTQAVISVDASTLAGGNQLYVSFNYIAA